MRPNSWPQAGTPSPSYCLACRGNDPLWAWGIVKQLYKRHGLYYKVIDEPKADDTLEEPVRNVALQPFSSDTIQSIQCHRAASGVLCGRNAAILLPPMMFSFEIAV